MKYEVRMYLGKTNKYRVLDYVEIPIDLHLKQNEEVDMASIKLVDIAYSKRIPKNTRIEIVETNSGKKWQFIVVYDDSKLTSYQLPHNLYTHDLLLEESVSLLGQVQLSNIICSKTVETKNSNEVIDEFSFKQMLENSNGETYILRNDIDINSISLIAPKFKGNFYGNGHKITIQSLSLNSNGKTNVGIIGMLDTNSSWQDLNIDINSVDISLSSPTKECNVGVLVGLNKGVLSKVNVNMLGNSTISLSDIPNGVFSNISVVANNENIIQDCQFSCDTFIVTNPTASSHTGTYAISGFCSKNKGTILNCSYEGSKIYRKISYSGYHDYIAGFTSRNYGNISNCYMILSADEGIVSDRGGYAEQSAFVTKDRYNKTNDCYYYYHSNVILNEMVKLSSGDYIDTLDKMKLEGTFVGFDFQNIWTTNNDTTYPKNISLQEKHKVEDYSYILDILKRILDISHTKYELSDNLINSLLTKYYGTISEFFFNDLNLLEILREIGTKINAIPKLVDYKYIDYYFLNTNENIWNDTLYTQADYGEKQSPDEYCTNLVSFGKNIVSSENTGEGNIVYPYKGGWASSKSLISQTVRISNDTAIFYLGGQKIYDIQNFTITNFDKDNPTRTADLTKFLYTKKQYDTLPDTEEGKGLALIYDQHGTYIYGLNNQPIAGFFPPYPALRNILTTQFNVKNINSYKDIKYNCVFRTEFNNIEKTEKVNNDDFPYNEDLVLNQTTNQVSSQNFSSYKSAKMNKLSNIDKTKVYVFDNINDLPNLGDKVKSNGYYVNEIKAQLYNNYVMAEIKMTKDFNKISEFISVNSRKRPFPIPVDNFISERHENVKEYVRLSLSPNEEYAYNVEKKPSHIEPSFLELVYYPFVDDDVSILTECNVAIVQTFDKDLEEISTLLMPVNSYVGSNNSLCYSFGMIDNVSAGYNSKNKDANNNILNAVLYTKKGLAEYISYSLLNNFETLNNVDISYDLPNIKGLPNSSISIFNTEILNEPELPYLVKKDLREILNFTTQIQFITDDSPIFIRQSFLNKNYTINSGVSYSIPKLYCLKDRELGEYENIIPKDAIEIKDLSNLRSELVRRNCRKLSFNCSKTECKCWFLAYDNGEIILGANTNLDSENSIYAIAQKERNSVASPNLALELSLETSADYEKNSLSSIINFKDVSIDEFSVIDYGDNSYDVINQIESDTINHKYSYNDEPYNLKIYSNKINNFVANIETSVENVKIKNVELYGDYINILNISNNDKSVQNIKINIIDISNKKKLRTLILDNIVSLENVILNDVNGLENISLIGCDLIVNDKEKLLEIIDNLNYNNTQEEHSLYADIKDSAIRQEVETALSNKNWVLKS